MKIIKPTFLIYDYETFGKNPALDKPSQFAYLRIDFNFDEILSLETFFCKIPEDYLPNIESIILTKITPQHTLKEGLVESEFAKKIYKIFNVPNTCILGYNNINFDDEFSRNIFYRNFLPPYKWAFNNGNSRWDLLNIILACYVLRPNGIIWPLNNKGLPSFKLEDITTANNISHNIKHDALFDIYAILDIIKLIKRTKPKLFYFLYNIRHKYNLIKLINNNKILLYISIFISKLKNNMILIYPLFWHPYHKNIFVTLDLNIKEKNLNYFNNININFLDKKILNKLSLYIKLININKCPLLIPFSSLRHEDLIRLNINYIKYKKIFSFLNKENIKERIKLLFDFSKKNINKSDNVDEQLYNGFFNIIDLENINIINSSNIKKLSKLRFNFIDKRLPILFFRYKARNYPFLLNYIEKINWKNYIKSYFYKKNIKLYIKNLNKIILKNKDKSIKKLLEYCYSIYQKIK